MAMNIPSTLIACGGKPDQALDQFWDAKVLTATGTGISTLMVILNLNKIYNF